MQLPATPFGRAMSCAAARVSPSKSAILMPRDGWSSPTLWDPYYSMIESNVADINNAGESGFAGSITAALFLKRFVERTKIHVHCDVFAWTPVAKPGRPKGGESQGARALFAALRERYGK